MGVMRESVLSVEFWDSVGKRLYVLQTEGNFWVGKFCAIFHSICEVIEGLGENSGNAKGSEPQLSPELSRSPHRSYSLIPSERIWRLIIRKTLKLKGKVDMYFIQQLDAQKISPSKWCVLTSLFMFSFIL